MKRNNYYTIAIAALIIMVISFTSCKKDGYLTDGGLAKAYTTLSTYDYLKNNQYHKFDTVLMLADMYNLKDTINNAKTFFAFSDISLHQLMTALHVTTLNQLTDSVSSKLFKQYMFSNTITIDDVTTSALIYQNYAGSAAPCALKKTAGTYQVYLNGSTPIITYYNLDYVKINGVLDGSPGAPANDPKDVTLSTQTEGIHTASGTVLNVLSDNAIPNKL